jgi:hypothetical protein
LLASLLQLLPTPALATDIFGVQDAALDQPFVNALLRRTPDGAPITVSDPDFGDIFGIQAFYDTGASGVVLSEQTADLFGVQRSAGVTFHDAGIGGSSQFHVSEPLYISVAPSTADPEDPAQYTHQFGPLRTQIGPLNAPDALQGTDILGIPTMQGKVVVMDPKPLNTLEDRLRTYVYDPGTPFKPALADSDPGIPHTHRSVALTFTSFSRFTRLTPENAEGPSQSANPFIGPNPLAKLDPNAPVDNTPGITLKLGDKQTTGSFLLDTGAQASVISRDLAAQLNVRYRPNSPDPILEIFDPAHPDAPGTELPNQFVITLTGTGGDETAAGFFLDSMLVRTKEGNPLDDDDPAHLRYLHAPVLVADISLMDPMTQQVLTLDGLFAMNFLVASISLSTLDIAFSPFDWVVFDPQNSVLGLELAAIPEPASFVLVLLGLVAVTLRCGWLRTRCQGCLESRYEQIPPNRHTGH